MSCSITGGIHISTNSTVPATASDRVRQVVGLRVPRPITSETMPPMPATPTKPTASGPDEILACRISDPTNAAPMTLSLDPSSDAALSRSRRNNGRITTIGFHGLTRAPSGPSE